MISTGKEGARVLVVDDETQIRRLLTVSLTKHGFQVTTASTGDGALLGVSSGGVDLVLLDLGLPDMDGVQVCRDIREWSSLPIIVVTARENEADKVTALDAGADDYVSKPFGMEELLARIRANLRRAAPGPVDPVLHFGALTVDLQRRTVSTNGQDVHLTRTEFEMLRVLALHAGRVLTHRQLLREARGPEYEGDTPLLRVHMVALRRKLGIAPSTPGHIATEAGVGYRLLT